jgi:hypothetical protein
MGYKGIEVVRFRELRETRLGSEAASEARAGEHSRVPNRFLECHLIEYVNSSNSTPSKMTVDLPLSRIIELERPLNVPLPLWRGNSGKRGGLPEI